MYVNRGKLKSHISNIKESIKDINAIRDKIKTIPDKDILNMCEEGFRFSFVHIREDIFSACTSLLKASSISVNTLDKNKNIIEMCIVEGYIKEMPRDFYMKLTKYRNDSCHKYKVPAITELLAFYDNYINVIHQFIYDLESIATPNTEKDFLNNIKKELFNNNVLYTETTLKEILDLIPPTLSKSLGLSNEERAYNYLNVYIKYKINK